MTPADAEQLHKSRHSLIVEGPDDGAVVNALVWKTTQVDLAQPDRRIVKLTPGRTGFENALPDFQRAAERLAPGHCAGLVVDRGNRPGGEPDRWPAVAAVLRALQADPPPLPSREGFVFQRPNGSRFGVWLMPDNINGGDLETFIEDSLPSDHPLWQYARRFVEGAHAAGGDYLPKDVHKANVHAWLACLDEPGGGYGVAIRRGDVPATSSRAVPFLAWMRQLFLGP